MLPPEYPPEYYEEPYFYEEEAFMDQPFMEEPKFSVYHLLELHAKARGKVVDDKKKADVLLKDKMFNEDYINILKYMGV